MSPRHLVSTLCFHAALLLAASTRFSVVSWMWGKSAWTWDYLQYAYRNGWGYEYQSDYSLAVVLAYIAAYSLGLIGYGMASRFVAAGWSILGAILCVLGLISFLIEGSHWLWSHHLSWILSCPAAGLLLAVGVLVQLAKAASKPAE
jgi:hypothetical protein